MKQFLWLKFYPKDWNGDHNLRACSLAARGLLAALFEPMHTAVPYGHLLLEGHAPDYARLAGIASCKEREVKYAIEELVKNGVLSRTETGVLFSRRMVRDAERREKRSKDGKTGGNPSLSSTNQTETGQRVSASEVNQQVKGAHKPIETRDQRPETRKNGSGATKEPSPAKDFLDWFQREYKTRRHGAVYFVSWDKHMPIIGRLLKLHDPQRLRKHAQLLLTTNEDWTMTTDRGIEVLAGKINWLEERLCAWEKERQRVQAHS